MLTTYLKQCNLLLKPGWRGLTVCVMGRWTLGQGRRGALDGQTGGRAPAPRPTMPCHSPSWCAIPPFFLPCFPPHVNRHTCRQTHWAHGLGVNWEKATAAICCRLEDYLAEAEQRHPEGYLHIFLFFSFLLVSSESGWGFTIAVGVPLLKKRLHL